MNAQGHRTSPETMREMVALLAHQVKNPLGAIKNAAYLMNLTLGPELPPDVTTSLAIINDEVRRANEIVAGFLELVRLRPARTRPVDLALMVTQCLAALPSPSEIVVGLPLPEGVMVNVDPEQSQRAIRHLLRHALSAHHLGAKLVMGLALTPTIATLTLRDADFAGTLPEDLDEPDAQDVSMDVLSARVLVENQSGSLSVARRARSLAVELALPAHSAAP